MGTPTNGRRQLPTLKNGWTTDSLRVGNCAPIVDTSPRSDADAASGDRPPTALGDREQDIPDWLPPFTEGLVEGESGSSGSVGESIPNTLPPHLPAKPKQKQALNNTAQQSSKIHLWICPERGRRLESTPHASTPKDNTPNHAAARQVHTKLAMCIASLSFDYLST